ncbi:hypothetical protein SAMN03080615_04106 [Amphritea atlantica]|uniref:Uncharacterized protein n=1 Tax=Amphritea atlantica TaxID=355243 RepID=A0A1H9LUB5_9GAMM|nr:hypothetical protein [Amphritea atlantica]SER15000.1 hypothetical protein SAMN03080615_04106 [Amphritea atlantica]
MKNKLFSVVDQGVFSGTNFVLLFVLSLAMDIKSYGEFSILLSLIALFQTIINSLVIEHLFVNRSCLNLFDAYKEIIFLWMLANVFFVFVIDWDSEILSDIFFVVFGWGISGIWLARRYFMSKGLGKYALLVSALYLIVIGALVLAVYSFDIQSFIVPVYFCVIAIFSILVCVFMVKNENSTIENSDSFFVRFKRDGFVFLLLSIVGWYPLNSIFVYWSSYGSVEDLGRFKIYLNFILPLMTLNILILLMLMKKVSTTVDNIRGCILEFYSYGFVINIVYMVLVWLALDCFKLFNVFYDNDVDFYYLLKLAGVAIFAFSLQFVLYSVKAVGGFYNFCLVMSFGSLMSYLVDLFFLLPGSEGVSPVDIAIYNYLFLLGCCMVYVFVLRVGCCRYFK